MILRNELGPQLRASWSGGGVGRGYLLTSQVLFRFGDRWFFLEHWREGTWYRYKSVEGDVEAKNLEELPEDRLPTLPQQLRILVE